MLNTLELKNFKNLNYKVNLSKDVNILYADNGSGKTNTLEAIYILSNASSFHSYPEKHLINFDEEHDFAKIKGDLEADQIEVIIASKGESAEKRLKVNGVNKNSAGFTKFLDVIFFSPNTVDLVSGSPDVRRKDLDDFLSKLDPRYRSDLNTYRKVIRNRNKLLYKLKSNQGSLEELDFWNEKMVSTGEYIVQKRIELIDRIETDVKKLARELFNEKFEGFEMNYQSKISLTDHNKTFMQIIMDNLDKEIFASSTLYGPHRDDIKFGMDSRDLKISGSRGQQRLAALIYKLALWNLLKSVKEKPPVILLDDIMSELDRGHRSRIEDIIKNGYFSQVMITSCDKSDFGESFWSASNIIELNQ